MADQETDAAESDAPSGGKSNMLVWLVVITFSLVGGTATPFVVAQMKKPPSEEPVEKVEEPEPEKEVDFIPFDEVTVNLDEARFSRYLKINFSLQVSKSQKPEIETLVKAKTAILKNWIQIHLAEKGTEDLRGRFGRNRVRREMKDFFNEVLFEDGIERIQDVLFDQFHVQ